MPALGIYGNEPDNSQAWIKEELRETHASLLKYLILVGPEGRLLLSVVYPLLTPIIFQ